MKNPVSGRLSRRKAIKIMGWAIFIPIAGLWNAMMKSHAKSANSEEIRIHLKDIPEGISYRTEFMIKREKMIFDILSFRCTHLGCMLKLSEGGLLECPCHGSVFDPGNGLPVKGPASKKMTSLEYRIENEFLIIIS